MGPKLSKRLQAISDLATKCATAADIGTDHAYIPVSLCLSGKAQKVIASDINRGPLKMAQATVDKYGLGEKIELRCAGGLLALKRGEADLIVISGMGGSLITDILSSSGDILTGREMLLLQPQRDAAMLRRRARESGYIISKEDMVYEDGKYYPVMLMKKESCAKEAYRGIFDIACGCLEGKTEDPRDIERISERLLDEFGPVLLENAHPVLKEWIKKEISSFKKILAGLESAGPGHEKRIEEINERLFLLETAGQITGEKQHGC